MNIEEKIIDIEKQIVRTEKILKKTRNVRSLMLSASKNLNGKYTYTNKGFLRGNLLGNFIRKSRVKSVNNNIDRVQEALLKLHADLMLYDQDFANKLSLPSKMTEFRGASNKLSDIGLRTSMRFREFDMIKSLRNLENVMKKLIARHNKLKYELKKSKEVLGYK